MKQSQQSGEATLRPGAVVSGLAGPQTATILSVIRLTDDSATVVYRNDEGALDEKIVFAEQLAAIREVSAGAAFTFDADPASFWLAAEARRMRLAFLFDPQSALGTSDVDPLPHQLRAVYQEMLPRQPLRFVLADDPGAGKTIMAGLFIKELLLRGDASNVLVIAPGSLVDQWQDELSAKFGLDFQILTKDLVAGSGNPFSRGGLWLARLDVLARNSENIQDKASEVDWDLIVADEAHKLSASVWGGEVKKTKRYQMAERLGSARNLLLMTATPHSGKEEQFQLFMALLDSDRFEGVPREGTRRVDVSDLMRRMIKEELLTFDGTHLFPERRSYTARYPLSGPERDLYVAVSDYVRDQMNLVAQLAEDGKRRASVGFALTTLQRRLASSPRAIHRSLERRLRKLTDQLDEVRSGGDITALSTPVVIDADDLDELPDDELEALEDEAAAGAFAARTAEQLEAEIAVVARLVDQAAAVRHSPTYSKWDRLRDTLDDAPFMRDGAGQRRKVIIFTEHKDTLDDLTERLRDFIGRDDAVVTIHGGTRREDRKKAQETFRSDDGCYFLVATDAAGEGVNLQNAHLVINYDLPWNPNRIEQRFGRVHRIGQQEVCHMWSLVAADTREGMVYERLLEKLEQQRQALGGRVFDVLGQVFDGTSLRDLMMDAIRYGDDPARRTELLTVIDAHVGDGIAEALSEEQLVPTMMATSEIDQARREMERAEAARLQPYHVEAFFSAAFAAAGGHLRPRESHRYEIRSVPSVIKDQDRITGSGMPVVNTYSRVAFDPRNLRIDGHTQVAALLHPGHPLMAALMSVTTDRHGDALRHGAILADRSDASLDPYVVCLLEHDVTDARRGRDAQPHVVSRRAQYVRLDVDGTIAPLGGTPLPNLEPPTDAELVQARIIAGQDWCTAATLEDAVVNHAAATLAREHSEDITASTNARIDKTTALVRDRLTREINYWDSRAAELREAEHAGKQTRLPASQLQQRADELSHRLDRRLAELESERALSARPPRITGACLVVPQGWFEALTDPEGAAAHAKETARVERLAVEAVLAVERAHGHRPVEMPHNNPGYDIESDTPEGLDFIEVKGRVEGGDEFVLTRTEASTALNKGRRSVLALVRVAADDTTTVRYLRQPITHPLDPRARSVTFEWDAMWDDGQEMTP